MVLFPATETLPTSLIDLNVTGKIYAGGLVGYLSGRVEMLWQYLECEKLKWGNVWNNQ